MSVSQGFGWGCGIALGVAVASLIVSAVALGTCVAATGVAVGGLGIAISEAMVDTHIEDAIEDGTILEIGSDWVRLSDTAATEASEQLAAMDTDKFTAIREPDVPPMVFLLQCVHLKLDLGPEPLRVLSTDGEFVFNP